MMVTSDREEPPRRQANPASVGARPLCAMLCTVFTPTHTNTVTPDPRRFSVCLMTDDGRLKILFHSDSYDQCDQKLDHYCDMFPTALVDIYKRDVLLNCELV